MELIGWIGSIAFAICGAPQAYRSWQQKHSHGISVGFLTLWSVGEIATIIYVVPKGDWPLIFNYVGNACFLSVIVWYKLYPKE